MKLPIKRLIALVSLALVASSASAGNLCYLGMPGMGCPNVASGGADSTQSSWVGAQSAPSGGAPWMPSQDQTTVALQNYVAGVLPLLSSGRATALPAGWRYVENMGYSPGANQSYYNLLVASGNADGTNWLIYNAASQQYGVWQIVTPHG
ncbi:hypothetical protein [Thiomonas intermedia]|uniref:hypothetical protein n=1 Tax=Thiomonas intermedia TaxID=926 RepID=UPI0009A4DB66|nr:hypothetical protein [Thiomonas intermedia]